MINMAAANDPQVLVARELKLRPKTKALFDEVINNPKITQREAYLKHHNSSVAAADSNASKLLRSDKYQIYKASAVGKAKRRVVSLIDSPRENIALKASQDVLDRTLGKAIQTTENINKTLEVRLDLSGQRIGAHYVAKLEQVVKQPPEANT